MNGSELTDSIRTTTPMRRCTNPMIIPQVVVIPNNDNANVTFSVFNISGFTGVSEELVVNVVGMDAI